MDKKIIKILKHSYDTVPYYNELFKKNNLDVEKIETYEDFQQIPLLRKDDINEQKHNFVSGLYSVDKLHEEYTSGSTGEPVCLYKSTADKINMGKAIWKIRNQRYGITAKDPYCRFHMVLSDENDESYVPPIIEEDKNVSMSLLHLTDTYIMEFYKLLKKNEVKWIFGMPSALFIIAEFITKNQLPPIESIKYIELSGEYRTELMKQRIAQAFDCDVADFYGLRETYGAAISCKSGKLHCVDSNVFLEVLDENGKVLPDGEEGLIYITSVNNFAMPLIRYATGDRGRLYRNVECECGECGNILDLSSTRTVDYIEYEDGNKINSAVVYCALVEVNKVLGDVIVQFQIRQKSFTDFLVKIKLLDQDVSIEQIKEIFEEYVTKFGMRKVNWNYEIVESIESSSKSGKLKYFIKEEFYKEIK